MLKNILAVIGAVTVAAVAYVAFRTTGRRAQADLR